MTSGQSRAGEEGDAQKLDDVRVAYGAHQLALSHELGRGLGQLFGPCKMAWIVLAAASMGKATSSTWP